MRYFKRAFPLRRAPETECEPRVPVVRHGHLGVRRQQQDGLNYIGVAIPVGRLGAPQMKTLASIAQRFGSGRLCPTVWQNVLIPDVPDGALAAAKAALLDGGFRHEASAVVGGIVACTGNSGCKFSATETKGHALVLGAHLETRLTLDQPLNIHLTGCPHSCAQHYIGDIGLLGVKVTVDGESVEAYNVLVGGGTDDHQALARELVSGVPFTELPAFIERLLKGYVEERKGDESFPAFAARCGADALRALVV
jgi:ferredoxin-nitrite reductase